MAAIAGTVDVDLTRDPIGRDPSGKALFLRDLWPTAHEVQQFIARSVDAEMFAKTYADVFHGDERWRGIAVPASKTYLWEDASTYIQTPPYFAGMGKKPPGLPTVRGARCLALFGDSITTDHISPAGAIKKTSPAGKYLLDNGVTFEDFNSYGSRRGNDRVMTRGTFANVRIKNLMLGGKEGGNTIGPDGAETSIYDASMAYQKAGVPLIILAGQEYGTGSSRDWAAKGTNLLGVKVVVAQSFERIHRSNLVGMGVLPVQFKEGDSRQTLGLTGDDKFSIRRLADLTPGQDIEIEVTRPTGEQFSFTAKCRIDTANEMEYYRNGGILHYVLRKLAA